MSKYSDNSPRKKSEEKRSPRRDEYKSKGVPAAPRSKKLQPLRPRWSDSLTL